MVVGIMARVVESFSLEVKGESPQNLTTVPKLQTELCGCAGFALCSTFMLHVSPGLRTRGVNPFRLVQQLGINVVHQLLHVLGRGPLTKSPRSLLCHQDG